VPSAGIGWSTEGYEVDIVGDDGHLRMHSRFASGRIDDIVEHLLGFDDECLITVIDSSLGIVDGRMMAAGLDVYRADPWVVPQRALLASPPAADLARAALANRAALQKLERHSGTQTGLEAVLAASIESSETTVRTLAASGRCFSHGDRRRDEVALTFDDGPQAAYTRGVLDVCERYGVPATFFCVGLHACGDGEVLARMREQGHAIGNHTWSHPFLWELTKAQLLEQVVHTNEAIAEASGGEMPTLFRPPYGSRTPEALHWLMAAGSTIVLWDVEPDDWTMPGPDVIATRVLDAARAGSIVVMHDGGGDRSETVAALPAIIEGLLDRGLRLVRADEMVSAA
jgi:peptidoglycan/xylan/chitin deacetylase (PgdA/CDA1 family)